MNLYQWTGLGRSVDLNLPSNRFVLLGSTAAGALALSISYLSTGGISIIDSGMVGVAAFLAWAIARELDPDDTRSAGAALIVATVFALITLPAIGAVVMTMLALRVLVGTVGSRLTTIDMGVLLVASALTASDPLAWPAIGALVYALQTSKARTKRLAQAGVAVAAAAGFVLSGGALSLQVPGAASMVLFGLLVAAVALSVPVSRVASICDDGIGRIDPRRLALARLLAIPLTAWAAIVAEAGVITLAPVVAASIGVGAFQLVRTGKSSRPTPVGSM